MSATTKTYLYKVYDRSGIFITTWPDVVSDFSLAEELNGAGGQVKVHLARPADDANEGVDLDFGFKVKIFCFDGDAPNGTQVFTGFISDYIPEFGGGEGVEVTLLSYGFELDEYIIGSDLAADQSQTAGSTDQAFNDVSRVAQSFVPAVSGLDSVEVKLRVDATQNVTLAIHEDSSGAPAVTPISGSTVIKEINSATFLATRFDFASQLGLVVGRTYWIVLTGPTGSSTAVDINGETSDANIHSFDSSYANARAGAGLAVSNYNTQFQIGQNFYTLYSCDELFIKFDTSSIPDSAVITAATLKIARDGAAAAKASVVEAYLRDWTAPLTTSDWVPGADIAALTRLATLATGSIGTSLSSMTSDGSNLINNINKTGFTNILLATDNFKNNTAPGNGAGNDESMILQPGEDSPPPTLSISYSAAAVYAAKATTDPYASGQMATSVSAVWTLVPGSDLYFKTYSSDNATTVAYSSQDPGAIMRDIMAKYVANGGNLSYDTSTIELTGTTVSYTFNTNTTLEGIKKCLELAPAGWYFYIDQANNMVHFHQKSGSLQRSFVLGKDIITLKPKKTIENMVNEIYFTGGGSPALFKRYRSTTSIGLYGRKARRYVDQRVTLAATALTIATAILDQHNAPEMQLEFELVDNNVQSPGGYDIELITLGEVVGFRNFGGSGSSLWDVAKWDVDYWDFNIKDIGTALLQIVRLERYPGSIKIFCSTVPPDVNKRIEDINRNLEATQTVDNPSSPS